MGQPVDGRTDQYSLAGVLYEMLAGEPPFTGPTAQAVVARRLAEPVRPLRPVRSTVPGRHRGRDPPGARADSRRPIPRHHHVRRRAAPAGRAPGACGSAAQTEARRRGRRRTPAAAPRDRRVAVRRDAGPRLAGEGSRGRGPLPPRYSRLRPAHRRGCARRHLGAGGGGAPRLHLRRGVVRAGESLCPRLRARVHLRRRAGLGTSARGGRSRPQPRRRPPDRRRVGDPGDREPGRGPDRCRPRNPRGPAGSRARPPEHAGLALSRHESGGVGEDGLRTGGLAPRGRDRSWLHPGPRLPRAAALSGPSLRQRRSVGRQRRRGGPDVPAGPHRDGRRRDRAGRFCPGSRRDRRGGVGSAPRWRWSNALAQSAELEARAGAKVRAREILRRADSLGAGYSPTPLHTALYLAIAHASVGDAAGAVAWLRRYAPTEDLHFQLHLRCDPPLDRLRGDSGFRAILDTTVPGGCS